MPILPDGREVDSYSPEWRLDCLRRWEVQQQAERERQAALAADARRHVSTLMRMPERADRAAYLIDLERTEGADLAAVVKAQFSEAWRSRRTQQPQSTQQELL